MSSVQIQGNAAGAGVFTIASPNSASSYTLTLPTATTTLVGTDATQTLTNKTIQGGAITSGTAVASTSGTSIDFTSIPSWVKRITVMFSGVSTSGTSLPMIQLGDSGGVKTTGYAAGSSQFAPTSIVTAGYTTGFTIKTDALAVVVMDGFITINLFTSASNTWIAGGTIYAPTANPAYMATISGAKSLSATLDRVRITTVNGTDTFDAGSINILYE